MWRNCGWLGFGWSILRSLLPDSEPSRIPQPAQNDAIAPACDPTLPAVPQCVRAFRDTLLTLTKSAARLCGKLTA